MRIILAIFLKNLNLGASHKTFKIQHYWLKYSNFKHLAFNISKAIFTTFPACPWDDDFYKVWAKYLYFWSPKAQTAQISALGVIFKFLELFFGVFFNIWLIDEFFIQDSDYAPWFYLWQVLEKFLGHLFNHILSILGHLGQKTSKIGLFC